MVTNTNPLLQHLKAVKAGQRRFENAFQGVSRMILESGIEKVTVNGKTTYDFKIFRNGPSTSSACTTKSTASSPM